MTSPTTPQECAALRLDIPGRAHTTFGRGTVTEVGALAAGLGVPAVVVITDAALAGTPVVTAVRDSCVAAGLHVRVFDGVRPNPTTTDVAAGAAVLDAAAPAAVVSVGGGSALDAAKAVAVSVAERSGPPGAPIVAVPTTAGSGAETNAFGVITDVDIHRKTYTGGGCAQAAAAVLDPDLTVSVPAPVTAATGVDALTHAIESYCSARPNPWSDGLALQAVRMIAGHLPGAVGDGTDVEARSQLLLAAHLSGLAMAGTGLGVCHAIAHPLGGRHDLPHGVALAMVLCECLRFNLAARTNRLADLAHALGAGDTHATSERNARAAIATLGGLVTDLGLDQTLSEHGIGAAEVQVLADEALADPVLANTPRWPSHEDVAGILRSTA